MIFNLNMSNISVVFNYQGNQLTVQCKTDEVIEDVFKRFCIKAHVDINNVKFYYDSAEINLFGKTLEALGVKNLINFNVVSKTVIGA